MSAIVTSPEDVDWYVNNRGWHIIRDRARRGVEPGLRDEFEGHVGVIGVDFRFVEPWQRPRVAQWLLTAVEALAGPEAAEHGWDSEADRVHLEEVADMLRRVVRTG